MRNRQCPCVTLEDFATFMLLPQQTVHGAKFGTDCLDCPDLCPWSARERDTMTLSLFRAQQTVSKTLGKDTCPSQKSIICDPDDCPIWLPPGSQIGIRELVAIQEVPICFTWRSACGTPVPTHCPDLDLIGQAIVDLPAQWVYDVRNIEFDYPTHIHSRGQCLNKPSFSGIGCCQPESPAPPPCRCVEPCGCPTEWVIVTRELQIISEIQNNCEYPPTVITYQVILELEDATGIAVDDRVMLTTINHRLSPPLFATVTAVDGNLVTLLPETAIDQFLFENYEIVTTPHILATWDKWFLVDPVVDSANLTEIRCDENHDGFIQSALVRFYNMNTDSAIEPLKTCSCTSCHLCTSCGHTMTRDLDKFIVPGYDYTFDENTGQLCFRRSQEGCSCDCEDEHKLKLYYWLTPRLDEDLIAAIILRAIIWHPPIKCSCGKYDKVVEHWLENDPGAMSEAFTNPGHYPYGKTRAGVQLKQLLEGDRLEAERTGSMERSSGLLSRHRRRKLW